LLVGSIGLVVLGLFFARKVRRFALYTLPELVKEQYDSRVALAASILIVIAWLGIIAGQIAAAGKVMSVLDAGSAVFWMVLFTVVFVSYAVLGGQHAIIRTDTLQSVIIFAGIFTTLALLLSHLGGISGLKDSLSPEQFNFPTSPAFWTAALIIPFALGVAVIGMGASALFPEIAAEQAFPMVIKEILPSFLGGIVLAALLCAVMSSADTCLLSASTILTMDVIKPLKPSLSQGKILLISRLGMVILGVIALVLAWCLGGVISSLLFAYTIYTAGLILPVIAGFYKDRLKVTPVGALAAIVGGGSVALVSKLLDIKYLDLGSLLISALLLFTVSLIDNRMRKRKSA